MENNTISSNGHRPIQQIVRRGRNIRQRSEKSAHEQAKKSFLYYDIINKKLRGERLTPDEQKVLDDVVASKITIQRGQVYANQSRAVDSYGQHHFYGDVYPPVKEPYFTEKRPLVNYEGCQDFKVPAAKTKKGGIAGAIERIREIGKAKTAISTKIGSISIKYEKLLKYLETLRK